MRLDVARAFQFFTANPKGQFTLSRNYHVELTFKRSVVDGLPNWYVIGRVIDKKSGEWSLAVASPFTLSHSRRACMNAVLFGIQEEFAR